MVDVEDTSEELEDVGSEVGSSELGVGSEEEDSSVLVGEDSSASLERLSEEEVSLELGSGSELGSVSELDEMGSELIASDLGSSEVSEGTGWPEESLLEEISEEGSFVEERLELGSSEETLLVEDEVVDGAEAGEEQLKRSRRRIPSGNSLRGAFCITEIIKDVCAFSYDR